MIKSHAVLWASVLIAFNVTAATSARADTATPWRLSDAIGAPPWLTFGLSHRTRVEHLDNQFRAAAPGTDPTVLVMRTLVAAAATFDPVTFAVELQDSRVAYASGDARLATSIVNPLEVLQAHVSVKHGGAEVKLGRITMDLGSRRLVARNRYRNTINGFTGIDARWHDDESRHTVRAFAVLPVVRRPSDADALRANDIELDEENADALFWGAFYSARDLAGGATLEVYALGLHERDGDIASRNRQLVTTGLRLVRNKHVGRVDFEIEGAAQLGTSRTSKATDDTTDLQHRAFFVHAQAGRTLPMAWHPRLIAQYDYASGDADPDDDRNGRFDTLFGARRFEWGPTGIYGPFARANINTPGVRVQVAPARRITAFVAYRLYWLASATDAWTTAGLRDTSGSSGKFLGHQVEARVRFNVLPGNLRVELGAARLARGRFALDVADAMSDEPATLVYAQLAAWI